MPETHTRGKEGEDIARAYLLQRGYRILDRNAVARSAQSGKMLGELDLVAMRGGDIVFVEVKAASGRHGAFRPEVRVSHEKLRRMQRAAEHWLVEQRKQGMPWQIDVIAVDIPEKGAARVRHLRRIVCA